VAVAEERDSPAVAEAARDLAKKLAEERCNAVVVGEFNRGKTTFVNAAFPWMSAPRTPRRGVRGLGPGERKPGPLTAPKQACHSCVVGDIDMT